MINQIDKKELEKKCLYLIGKTLVDLGQVKPADEKVVLAKRLSQILITRYPKFSWQAVEQAFDDGVLESEEFQYYCLEVLVFHEFPNIDVFLHHHIYFHNLIVCVY